MDPHLHAQSEALARLENRIEDTRERIDRLEQQITNPQDTHPEKTP